MPTFALVKVRKVIAKGPSKDQFKLSLSYEHSM